MFGEPRLPKYDQIMFRTVTDVLCVVTYECINASLRDDSSNTLQYDRMFYSIIINKCSIPKKSQKDKPCLYKIMFRESTSHSSAIILKGRKIFCIPIYAFLLIVSNCGYLTVYMRFRSI